MKYLIIFSLIALCSPMSIEADEVSPGILRTPDDRFENLEDFPFQPNYMDIQGLRIAWSMDLGFFEVDEHVQANTLKTLDVLKDLGAELVEVDFGWSAEADRALQNYLDHLLLFLKL